MKKKEHEEEHAIVPRADTLPTTQTIHPLAERILANNPTPEALEKVMALQERHEANMAKRAFTDALVRLRAALPPWIEKDVTVAFPAKTAGKSDTKYKHTSLAKAVEVVKPFLSEYGFSLTFEPSTKGTIVSVTAELIHREGHSKTATIEAPADTSGNKTSAQGVASTITLLERYSGLALLGMATKDMEEPKPTDDGKAGKKVEESVVDSALNLKAMGAISNLGKTKQQAEKFIGRPVQKWTAKDIDKLRKWIEPLVAKKKKAEEKKQAKVEAPPKREPAPTSGDLVSKGQVGIMEGWLKEFHLTAKQFKSIYEVEFGTAPASVEGISKPDFGKLDILFGRLRNGEVEMKKTQDAAEFVRPPDELNREAEQQKIPF